MFIRSTKISLETAPYLDKKEYSYCTFFMRKLLYNDIYVIEFVKNTVNTTKYNVSGMLSGGNSNNFKTPNNLTKDSMI